MINICMKTQPLDLIKKYINADYFGDTPLEEVPLWEIRDNMSHSTNLQLDNEEFELVNNIVDNKAGLTWTKEKLSIIGEAKVQQLLRLKGYDLLCVDLNVFPTSCAELSQYVPKYSLKNHIIFRSSQLKGILYKILCESVVTTLLKVDKFRNIIVPGIIIYAIYLNFSLLVWALLAAYILSNCVAIVMHEYWVHDQIKPKNRLIGFVFDWVGLMGWGSPLIWKYQHSYHHIHWKTRKDIEQIAMLSNPWWRYLFIGYNFTNTKFGDLTAEYAKHTANSKKYREDNINKLLPESRFLEKYSTAIVLASHLLLLLTLGLLVYIYFVLLQIWIFQRYIPGFNELVTHYNDKTREEEADTPYLFPICCGTAYHNTHHTQPTTLVLGPGWLKYFNVQYYFIKLFYNVSPGIKMS